MTQNTPAISALVLATTFTITGCSSQMVKPESLRTPDPVTCFKISEQISFTPTGYKWDTRLAVGLYISEREDDGGTYYRGPAGAVTERSHESPEKYTMNDGGVFIPKDKSQKPRPYFYFSTSSAQIMSNPEIARATQQTSDCSAAVFTRDPVTQSINVYAWSAAGAAGGMAGRATVSGSSMSYGQAMLGGAIGMGVVALMINADVGKIAPMPLIDDATAIKKLTELARNSVIIKEAASSAVGK